MAYRMTTRKGYALFDVASALQKSIRRGDAKTAGFFALELLNSGYARYLWKRLFIISAEDIAGCVTQEIDALYNGFMHVNSKTKKKLDCADGQLFVAKAVILLSQAYKCRDSDHLTIYVYHREKIDKKEVKRYLDEVTETDRMAIPEYAYDCHTSKGKAVGKTKDDFLITEFESLKPKIWGLFDDLLDE